MIPKRLFWFAVGAATGAVGAAYVHVRVREARGLRHRQPTFGSAND